MSLTPLGWAVIPFVVVVVVAIILVVYLLRVRWRVTTIGFDLDEATNYIWRNLTTEEKGRIAMGHVARMLEACRAAESIETDADLSELLAESARLAGAELFERDVARIVELQYEYAGQKQLFD